MMSLLWNIHLYAQNQDQSQRLNTIIDTYHQLGLFNGNVLIAEKNKIIFEKSYGYADLAAQRKNVPGTRFNIYSITKPVTASVILQLVAENKLRLDEPISRFFPALPDADSITIEQLLTHSSGLYAYNNDFNMPVTDEAAMIDWLIKQPLAFRPGSSFQYNNTGYFLLGYIIGKVTGVSYEDAVRARVLTPLKMDHSNFDLRSAEQNEKAKGYTYISGLKGEVAPVWDYRELYAAGGMYATNRDLLLFHQAMRQSKLLPEALLRQAYTAHKKNYGYGWFVDSVAGHLIISHSGGATGFRSYLIWDSTANRSIILLCNAETSDIVTIKNLLLSELNGQSYHLPAVISLSPSQLSAYEGAYQLTPSMTLYIHKDKGQLMATPSRQGASVMLPAAKNSFRIESKDIGLLFTAPANGSYDTLVFSQKGQTVSAPRLHAGWGITGTATPNGWEGKDVAMMADGNRWTISSVTLKDGVIKFRYNNDWVLNYGLDQSGMLKKGANDIPVTAGTYSITLDLTDPDKVSFKIVEKN
ncbi:serine hydrolase [Sediminibacterium ginsengisoli]|uniref:CubicO group peptidase, beta-lactamase class C family n=1 Tax=Sediminibacterium ginsengisoli TaxID=413434 RepID=A0A1T4LJJ6_9BACT|nr:serine hydrolase [Sediminibacterium ginsengisoli]SJZ54801.1 CubicO group peptidase, beta-lactamase class C family [Sediminibacterium ginsengisoli]